MLRGLTRNRPIHNRLTPKDRILRRPIPNPKILKDHILKDHMRSRPILRHRILSRPILSQETNRNRPPTSRESLG